MGVSNRPFFLFAGTAKSGTTAIYENLKHHPSISIPVKETFFFMRDVLDFTLPYPCQRPADDLILDQEQYNILYPPKSDIKYGEIGTGYLYFYNQSIPLIKEVLGEDVRIMIILRNPIDRAFSSYLHFYKDSHETLTFRESIEKERERISAKWDFMWHHTSVGFYYQQVKAFLENFKNVKIFLYDDLKKDPQSLMKEIFTFIEVDSDLKLPELRNMNISGAPKNKTFQKLITHENPVKTLLRPAFRMIFSKEQRSRIRKSLKELNIQKIGPMDDSMRTHLKFLYKEDLRNLEKLIGRDLSSWYS